MDINEAIQRYQAGDREAARSRCEAILAAAPGHTGAQLLLGRLALDSGDHAAAEAHLAPLVRSNPNHLHAVLFLSAARVGLSQFAEASAGFERVLDTHPDVGPAWRYLGICRLQLGDLPRAQVALGRAVELEPGNFQGWFRLGEVLFLRAEYERSAAAYQRCVSLRPGHAESHGRLGSCLARLSRFEEASASSIQAISLAPGEPTHRSQLGWIMLGSGQLERAEQRFREVLRTDDEDRPARVGLGTVLERLGRHAEALDLLAPMLDGPLDMNLVVAHALVQLRLGRAEAGLPHLEKLLQRPLPNAERVLGYHTLGTLRDALGEENMAFAAHTRANELRRLRFDIHAHRRFIDALIGCANSETLAHLPRPTHDTRLPIFIVGMPRSGTSLVEQILATHPGVHGFGEHIAIRDLALGLHKRLGVPEPYPICLDLITPEAVNELSANYLSLLSGDRHIIRVTDKTPFNFLHLGLIGVLFPGARVIHCRRDAMDTCLSCYFQNFNDTETYATSLPTLGAYYREYRRLMVHWRAVSGVPILDFEYERLVDSPEERIRALLEFCELPWDPSCLEFHRNPRGVNTPSYAQLRQPIFSSSVGRWKRYARHLEPLREALGL